MNRPALWLTLITPVLAFRSASRAQETRPAASQPAAAAPVLLRPARPAGLGARAQRDANRTAIAAMADGGAFKLQDLVRLSLVDGRIQSTWAGRFPTGQALRIKIDGSDAVWTVHQFVAGAGAYFTLTRYDFDAPDDAFWTTAFTAPLDSPQNQLVTLSAQGGETCPVQRFFYTQQESSVMLTLTEIGRAHV